MIRLSPLPIDLHELARTPVAPPGEPQPEDYRDRVVLKPWGHEFLCYESEVLAAWCLRLAPGQSTSLHCHPQKRTALVVIEGAVEVDTLTGVHPLHAGAAATVEAGVFHALRALEPGARVIEIESPRDKTDLVRLRDAYGRTGSGYEGLSRMVDTDLHAYDHFWLSEATDGHPVALHRFESAAELAAFEPRRDRWYSPADATLALGGRPVEPGTVLAGTALRSDRLALGGLLRVLELGR